MGLSAPSVLPGQLEPIGIYSAVAKQETATLLSMAEDVRESEKKRGRRREQGERRTVIFVEAADGWEHRGMPQHCRGEGLNQAGRALLAPPAAVDAHSRFMRMKAEGFYYKCF